MNKADRVFLGVVAFMVGGVLAYCSVMWFGISLPRYYPTGHAWKWTKDPGVPSQGWYAAQAFALSAGVLAGAAVHWLAGRWKGGALSPGIVKSISVVTVLVLAGCLGYLMWHEFAKWGVIG